MSLVESKEMTVAEERLNMQILLKVSQNDIDGARLLAEDFFYKLYRDMPETDFAKIFENAS